MRPGGPAWTEMSGLEATCIGVHMEPSQERSRWESVGSIGAHAPTHPRWGLLTQLCYCERRMKPQDTGSSLALSFSSGRETGFYVGQVSLYLNYVAKGDTHTCALTS